MAKVVYIAKREQQIDGETRHRGALVPEARDWSNVDAFVDQGYLEKVVVPDDFDEDTIAEELGYTEPEFDEDEFARAEAGAAELIRTVSPEVKAAVDALLAAGFTEEEVREVSRNNEKFAEAEAFFVTAEARQARGEKDEDADREVTREERVAAGMPGTDDVLAAEEEAAARAEEAGVDRPEGGVDPDNPDAKSDEQLAEEQAAEDKRALEASRESKAKAGDDDQADFTVFEATSENAATRIASGMPGQADFEATADAAGIEPGTEDNADAQGATGDDGTAKEDQPAPESPDKGAKKSDQ